MKSFITTIFFTLISLSAANIYAITKTTTTTTTNDSLTSTQPTDQNMQDKTESSNITPMSQEHSKYIGKDEKHKTTTSTSTTTVKH